ncbi:hypothetical protein F5Y17DRAFT_450150 [Xylariaceae sp. FL0594]|nr:hypothetical protein F5Y17DRAFT_450150 [Xylariaceae sp. FL0594]
MSSVSKDEGRQSPPPEAQSGAQMHDTPASGKGTDSIDNKGKVNDDQLKVRTYQSYHTRSRGASQEPRELPPPPKTTRIH